MPKEYPNSGTLFKNDKKTEAKHPDYKGHAEVDGVEYWLSGWIKKAGDKAQNPGSTFLSLSFEPKDKVRAAQSGSTSSKGGDDFPF